MSWATVHIQFCSVQLLSRVRLFVTPWTAAHQASLSNTNSQSLSKLVSIQLVMPSNHLILCHPLLLLPSIFLSIRVFSNESALGIRWPKYGSFGFNISPSNEHSGLISFRVDRLDRLDFLQISSWRSFVPQNNYLSKLIHNHGTTLMLSFTDLWLTNRSHLKS